MPTPAVTAPTLAEIEQATATLARLAGFLRTEPPTADVLPLLVPLLDEDNGVPMQLSDALRAAARAIATHTPPVATGSNAIVASFREAATEIMNWHVLHWDVRQLRTLLAAHPAHTTEPGGEPCP